MMKYIGAAAAALLLTLGGCLPAQAQNPNGPVETWMDTHIPGLQMHAYTDIGAGPYYNLGPGCVGGGCVFKGAPMNGFVYGANTPQGSGIEFSFPELVPQNYGWFTQAFVFQVGTGDVAPLFSSGVAPNYSSGTEVVVGTAPGSGGCGAGLVNVQWYNPLPGGGSDIFLNACGNIRHDDGLTHTLMIGINYQASYTQLKFLVDGGPFEVNTTVVGKSLVHGTHAPFHYFAGNGRGTSVVAPDAVGEFAEWLGDQTVAAAAFTACITGAQNGPCPAPLNEANLIARVKTEINATGATTANKHYWPFDSGNTNKDVYNSTALTCIKAANPPNGVVADATKCHPATAVFGPIQGVTFDHNVGGVPGLQDFPAAFQAPKFTWADNITANKPGFIAMLVLPDPTFVPGVPQDWLSITQYTNTAPGAQAGTTLELDTAGCNWGGPPPASHFFVGQAINATNLGTGNVPIGGPNENLACDASGNNPLDSKPHLLVINFATNTSPATFQVDAGTPINLPPLPPGGGTGLPPDGYVVTPGGSTWATGAAVISSPAVFEYAYPPLSRLGQYPIGPNAAVIGLFQATGGVKGLDTAAQNRILNCVWYGSC